MNPESNPHVSPDGPANRRPLTILLADDDEEDRMFVEDALQESGISYVFKFVEDGEELMDYLLRRKRHQDLQHAPRPDLILLDLNMPRKNGREALQEIKADMQLRTIPVVMLTTSSAHEDVLSTYASGANSYITKPVTFSALVQVMRHLGQYWGEMVQLPARPEEE